MITTLLKVNLYSNQHAFEQNAWFAFCDLFRMPVNHKIG